MSSKKRNFYRGDYKTTNSKLLEIDWNVMDDMNVEQCWSYFSENVKTVINYTIPIHKDPQKKPNLPGWTIIALSLLFRNTTRGNVIYTFSRNRIHYLNSTVKLKTKFQNLLDQMNFARIL